MYSNNNRILYVDPSGLASVIFVSSNMSGQADNRKAFYTEKYGTDSYKIEVSSAEDFVKKWNNFFKVASEQGTTIDAIEIISHGSIDGKDGKYDNGTAYSTGYIYFTEKQENKLYARDISGMKKGDRSVSGLDSITAAEFNINSCNGANPDTYNVLYGFMGKVTAGQYTGFDGGAQWDPTAINPGYKTLGDHIRGGGEREPDRAWYKGGEWYYVKRYQHTWWKYVEKYSNGDPVRSRTGRTTLY